MCVWLISFLKYTSSERRRNIYKLLDFQASDNQNQQQNANDLAIQEPFTNLGEESHISEGSISITDVDNLNIERQSEIILENDKKTSVTVNEMIISYSLRHNLTDSAIKDLIKMLQVLGVPNTPKNISDFFKKSFKV